MGLSVAIPSNSVPPVSCRPRPKPFPQCIEFKRIAATAEAKNPSLHIIKSVLNGRKLSVSDNGAAQPARVLLENLLARTQKCKEQMNTRDHQELITESVESDLLAVLEALKKKEEDLQDVERKVLLEHGEISRAKEVLEEREKAISAACSEHETLEGELKQATLDLVSRASKIEDLNLQLWEKDQEIAAAQTAITLKKDELNKMSEELERKSEEAVNIKFKLNQRDVLLDEANEVMNKQQSEIQVLQKAIEEKGKEVEVSMALRKIEEEKLKAAESKLEKQTMQWFMAQEELRKLAVVASKHAREANDTMEEFGRVKKLLSDVRFEIVSSQKSLASSRRQMEEQEQLLNKQLAELEEQRQRALSHMSSLKDAQMEVEGERAKLRVAEAQNKELERDLSIEKELMLELREGLLKDKYSLDQAIQEMTSLRGELDRKNTEFGNIQRFLQNKESQLVEAKLEIQHLKAEHTSLHIVLKERDLQLLTAMKKLEEVNLEVADLTTLMRSKEDQLVEATATLQEKDKHVHSMQEELNKTRMRVTEAETVVEKIVELTDELVVNDENYNAIQQLDGAASDITPQPLNKPSDDFSLQKKQLETELKLTRESLRVKEMEVLAANRVLAIKDEQLKMFLGRLDDKEKELRRLREEMIADANELKRLYALAQEKIGDKTMGDLAIEKLQLEAAQLEVQAATSALYKIAEMSRGLLNKANLSIEADIGYSVFPQNGLNSGASALKNNECIKEIKTQVTQLSTLTEQLVKEAGVPICAE